MRAVRVKVSTTLIEQAVKLPSGVHVWLATTSREDLRDGLVEVTLVSDEFPEVPEGEDPPLVSPIVRVIQERRDWDFGLPAAAPPEAS